MSNPFAALLQDNSTNHAVAKKEPSEICDTIENIFGFTLNKSRSSRKGFIYLADQADTFPGQDLDLEILEHALFERLLLSNLTGDVPVASSCHSRKYVYETNVVTYLFECYSYNTKTESISVRNSIKSLIMRNILTSFKQPDLYSNQDVFAQVYEVLKDSYPDSEMFFKDIYESVLEDEEGIDGMKEPYMKLLKVVHVDVANFNAMTFDLLVLNVINMFTTNENLANIFLNYCLPKNLNAGNEYANTLLGALFSISIVPKTSHGEYDYFLNPLDHASNSTTEGQLFGRMEKVTQSIHSLIWNLLKCSATVKSKMLLWLGNCLKANSDRGKLWNMQAMELNSSTSFSTVSDGFMINFLTVMMRFCQPFCSPENEKKILKVDPTYCAVDNESCEARGIHLLDLSQETCLVPASSDTNDEGVVPERLSAQTYNFVTECFFMGHRTFDLGYRVIMEKLVKLNQEMIRIDRAYSDAINQTNGLTSEVADSIQTRMKGEMQKYLSIKASLSEPLLLDMLFNLMSASSSWLNQIAVHVDSNQNEAIYYAPLTELQINFPIPERISDTLKCIPEFVVENIVCYLVFLRRFNPKLFEVQGYERLKPILTFILIYMGSPQRMKNPHLRARLAEALEALLPFHKDEPAALNNLGSFQREMLFTQHEHRKEIVRSLLEVFVAIEMTGQSVQFEQKFNYRRPMYLTMDYLWELPEHQQYFKQLAEEAENSMDAVTPPLFLRFINLLMNDAVYLLDEALANMSKLREMETARENGEWNSLPFQERAQNMGYIQHIGMIARFDNILGRDTIRSLVNLTSKITIVFTHSTMVDRVAAMLNYFLLNLVGPNQKNFKVKDHKEYSFEPAETVLDICKIYVNLKDNDFFCLAVSQDGRSYSPQLFTLAEDVLVRIGGGALVGELQEVAVKVAEKSIEYQMNEEVIAEAPERFLDPIMSTLMLDPVILPSSKQTVDRTTIARHLLSDQTDPFNRSQLTLDQVIPNTELAEEIRKWITDRKSCTK